MKARVVGSGLDKDGVVFLGLIIESPGGKSTVMIKSKDINVIKLMLDFSVGKEFTVNIAEGKHIELIS